MRVGDLTLVGLNDGEFTMNSDFLGADAHRLLAGADGEVHLPIATFYLPGDEALLIDAGMGPDDSRIEFLRGGQLLGQLHRIGAAAADIRHVAISHLHPDHSGWIATAAHGPTFVNAQHHVGAADWAYFVVEGNRPRLTPWVRDALITLGEKGRLTLLDEERSIVRGVTALPAPGHTPGHTVYVISSGGDRALVLGDSIYCPHQLTETDWEAASEVDPVLARRTRSRLWEEVERSGGPAIGPHFPGLLAGRVLSGAWTPS